MDTTNLAEQIRQSLKKDDYTSVYQFIKSFTFEKDGLSKYEHNLSPLTRLAIGFGEGLQDWARHRKSMARELRLLILESEGHIRSLNDCQSIYTPLNVIKYNEQKLKSEAIVDQIKRMAWFIGLPEEPLEECFRLVTKLTMFDGSL